MNSASILEPTCQHTTAMQSPCQTDLLPINLENRLAAPEGSLLAIPVVDADRLQERLRCCSPATRVPPEVLAYIFGFYVDQLGEVTPDDIRVQGPTCLAQVCTLWRAVVEPDPQLWTSIHFYFPESRKERGDDVLRVKPAFDLHLERSRALPISLSFTDHRSYASATEDLVSLLVGRLRMHAPRWKRISLHLAADYMPLLFKFAPCDLSSLDQLSISSDLARRLSRHSTGAFLLVNLESATNLKSFTYSGPRHPLQGIRLHWGNLSEVSFGFAPHMGWSNTLVQQFGNISKCQNVTTCSLGIEGIDQWRLHGSETVILPRLETLRVRRLSAYAHAGNVLDLLILPKLQILEIDALFLIGWNERWHDDHFSNLLARSGCSLLHLSIKDVDFPNDELFRCLALSPSLTSLHFIPCPRSQDIREIVHELDAAFIQPVGSTLTWEHGQEHKARSAPLVPSLRQITLGSSEQGYLDPMMAMCRSRVGARARASGVATLRRAEVIFFDLWHDAVVEQLRGKGDRSERIAGFCADMARWVSENENGDGRGSEEKLRASVVVDSPYLPGYIDIR